MLASLGHALAANHDRSAALRIIHDLERLRGDSGLFAYEIGLIYAALREIDDAFQWLSQAVQERST